jgi:hypothetical protein
MLNVVHTLVVLAFATREPRPRRPGESTPPGLDHRRGRVPAFATTYGRAFPSAVKCLLADREQLTSHLRFPSRAQCENLPGACDHSQQPGE